MNDVLINFDPNPRAIKTNLQTNIGARTENIESVPTTSKGLGLLPKNELLPGVYIVSSLTRAVNGVCLDSIINTMEPDQNVELTWVVLEGLDERETSLM